MSEGRRTKNKQKKRGRHSSHSSQQSNPSPGTGNRPPKGPRFDLNESYQATANARGSDFLGSESDQSELMDMETLLEMNEVENAVMGVYVHRFDAKPLLVN